MAVPLPNTNTLLMAVPLPNTNTLLMAVPLPNTNTLLYPDLVKRSNSKNDQNGDKANLATGSNSARDETLLEFFIIIHGPKCRLAKGSNSHINLVERSNGCYFLLLIVS